MTPAAGNPRKFHKGPPPFPGWWWTKIPLLDVQGGWRWWNGRNWSVCGHHLDSLKTASRIAFTFSVFDLDEIEWSDYWPANARVPRINPNKETA